jgi:F-type H+-transporting ATPase subunit b
MRYSRVLYIFLILAVFMSLNVVTTCLASEGAIKVLQDASVVVQIINFLILVILLNIFLYKPIRTILIKRKDRIYNLEKSVKNAVSEAEEGENAFNKGIKNARVNGLNKKEEFIAEAVQEEKRIVEQITQKVQAEMAEVKNKIANDVEETKKSLAKEIDTFANNIAEKILGRAI